MNLVSTINNRSDVEIEIVVIYKNEGGIMATAQAALAGSRRWLWFLCRKHTYIYIYIHMAAPAERTAKVNAAELRV